MSRSTGTRTLAYLLSVVLVGGLVSVAAPTASAHHDPTHPTFQDIESDDSVVLTERDEPSEPAFLVATGGRVFYASQTMLGSLANEFGPSSGHFDAEDALAFRRGQRYPKAPEFHAETGDVNHIVDGTASPDLVLANEGQVKLLPNMATGFDGAHDADWSPPSGSTVAGVAGLPAGTSEGVIEVFLNHAGPDPLGSCYLNRSGRTLSTGTCHSKSDLHTGLGSDTRILGVRTRHDWERGPFDAQNQQTRSVVMAVEETRADGVYVRFLVPHLSSHQIAEVKVAGTNGSVTNLSLDFDTLPLPSSIFEHDWIVGFAYATVKDGTTTKGVPVTFRIAPNGGAVAATRSENVCGQTASAVVEVTELPMVKTGQSDHRDHDGLAWVLAACQSPVEGIHMFGSSLVFEDAPDDLGFISDPDRIDPPLPGYLGDQDRAASGRANSSYAALAIDYSCLRLHEVPDRQLNGCSAGHVQELGSGTDAYQPYHHESFGNAVIKTFAADGSGLRHGVFHATENAGGNDDRANALNRNPSPWNEADWNALLPGSEGTPKGSEPPLVFRLPRDPIFKTVRIADARQVRTELGGPAPIAVLAAPPQVAGAGQDPDGGPSFLQSQGSSQEESKTVTGHWHASFSAGVEFEVPFLSETEAKIEAEYHGSIENTESLERGFSITEGVTGDPTQDTIVYKATEYWVFDGTVLSSSLGFDAGEPFQVQHPRGAVTTSENVNSFRERFPDLYGDISYYGDSLERFLSHTPGDPGSYMKWGTQTDRSDAVADYCLGDFDPDAGAAEFDDGPNLPDTDFFSKPSPKKGPDILTGATHRAQTGTTGSESSSMEITESHSNSRIESHGFDLTVSVEQAVGAGSVGLSGGGGMTWGRGWTSTLSSGTEFEGHVGHIPDGISFVGESYNWRAFMCKRELAGAGTSRGEIPVWVLNYTVDGYEDGTRGVPGLTSLAPVAPNHVVPTLSPVFEWDPTGIGKSYDIDIEPVGFAAESQRVSASYPTAKLAKQELVGCANLALSELDGYGRLSVSADGLASEPSPVSDCDETATGSSTFAYDVEFEPGRLYRWRVTGTDFAKDQMTSDWLYFETPTAPDGTIVSTVERPEGDARRAVPVAGESVTFKVDVSDEGGSDVVSYDWDLGEGIVSDDEATGRVFDEAGLYPIEVMITNAGGLSRTLTDTVTISDPSPIADFAYSPDDPSTADVITFTDVSVDDLAPPGASLTYAWDFGDGNGAASSFPTHRYAEPGTYPVTLTVTSIHGDPSSESTPRFADSITRFVHVEDGSPSAGFSFTPSQPATTDTIGFQDTSTDQNAGDLIASWDFGDGTTATGSAVDHRYTEPGVYEVTMSVRNATTGLTSEIRRTIGVSDFTPSPDFGTSADPSTASDVSFTYVPDPSQPTPDSRSFSWDFGDGTTATGEDPTHRYQAPGSYTVRLDVTEVHGGVSYTGSVMRSVHVADGSPSADFSFSPLRPSTADVLSFEDLSTDPDPDAALEASWDFGDGTGATGSSPEHRYAEPGAYEVTLTVRNPTSGLASTMTRTISVSDGTPRPRFHWSPTDVSTADAVDFTSTTVDPGGRPVTTEWRVDDGSARSSLRGFRFTDPGTHEVTLTVTNDAGLSDQLTRTLYVSDGSPVPDIYTAGGFTSTPTEFIDRSFDPGDRDLTYRWDWGDGSQDLVWESVQRPEDGAAFHRYAQPGRYTVTLTVTNDAGLSTSKGFFVEILDGTPEADFLVSPESPTTSVPTVMQDRSIDPAGLDLTYAWDLGDGATSTEASPSHIYAEEGVYTVELTVTNPAGMSDTISRTIRVEPGNPLADFSWAPTHPISLDEVTFTSGSRDPAGLPLSHEWDFGDGTPVATGAEVTHAYAHPGIYAVTLTVTNSAGEVDTVVSALPVRNRAAQAGFTYTPERPWLLEPVLFADTSADPDGEVVAWQWDFGDGSSSSLQHPQHQYMHCGVYRVKLTIWDDSGASSSYIEDVRVSIYPGVRNPDGVCAEPPADPSSSDGSPAVHVDQQPYYLSSAQGGTIAITGRAVAGDAELRNVVVALGEGSSQTTVSVEPYDAAGRFRALFEDYLLPGEYQVEVIAWDEEDRASAPARMKILVI